MTPIMILNFIRPSFMSPKSWSPVLVTAALCSSLGLAQSPEDPEAFRRAFLAGDVPWDEVVSRAQTEGEVVWAYWGGSEELNFWADTAVTPQLAELGITLDSLRVPDTRDAVELVLADAAAGQRLGEGTVDLIWINGENFFTLEQQALLFGPFTDNLPNAEYFYLGADDPRARINLNDNGYPTQLQEVPWAKFQYTCMIDTARLPRGDAPRTFAELETFLTENPGRFTYVRPPDYIGNTFVQSVLYAFNPDATDKNTGNATFLRAADTFTPAEFARLVKPGFDYLRRLEPLLLGGAQAQPGQPIYPETQAANEAFLVNGEVDMLCQMGAFTAAVGIESGAYPETVENIIFPESGMLANKSYLAIPTTAPHPAAALVLANLLSSPASHADKLAALGYFPGVDLPLLNAQQQTAVEGAAPDLRGVTFAELAQFEVPDTNASLVEIIEAVWLEVIAQDSQRPFDEIVASAFEAQR